MKLTHKTMAGGFGIPLLLLSVLALFSVPLMAQTVTIPGFEGITFQKHGTDEQISITENFHAFGIEFSPNDLTLGYKVSGEEFYMYGGATFSTEHETVEVSFGSASSPGLTIKGTTVEHFELDINSDLTFGNIKLETKDLDIQYYNAYKRFYVAGTVIIKEVFELEVDLGSATERGVEVDVSGTHPKLVIDNLTIKVENLNAGSVDLNDFELTFNKDGITDSKVDVSFGGGQEVAAEITFDENPIRMNSIDIRYRADNLEDGIELFEGVQIAYMDAKVTNLDKPHSLEVSGSIQAYYGEGLTFDNVSATFFETGADITVSSTEMHLHATGNLGAVRSGDSNNWHGELGSGYMDLKIYFQKKDVDFAFHTEYPSTDGFIDFDAAVSFSLHELDAYAKVGFIVPHVVPLIGGKSLGSVEGNFHYVDNLKVTYRNLFRGGYTTRYVTGGSFAAWVDVNFYIGHVRAGAEIDFPGNTISVLGSKAVKSREDNFPGKMNALNPQPINQMIHSFEVNQNPPTFIMFQVNWHQMVDTVAVTILGPGGYSEVHQIYVSGEGVEGEIPEFALNRNIDVITNDSSAYLMITTPTRFGDDYTIQPTMIDGRYSVVLDFPNQQPDSSTITMHQYWQQPEIEVEVTKSESENAYTIDYNFWASQTDSAMITIFVAEKNDLSSAKPIQSFSTADPELNIETDINNYGSGTIEYSPDFVSDADSLYFYASINDQVNAKVYSTISDPIHHKGDIHGSVIFPENADSLKAGLRLYLDENNDGRFDLESDGGVEPYAISFEDGDFHFLNIEKGTYPLRVILPKGYRMVGTESRLDSIEVIYDGSATNYTLEIETYTEN